MKGGANGVLIATAVLQLFFLRNFAISEEFEGDLTTTENPQLIPTKDGNGTSIKNDQLCAKYNGSYIREFQCCKSKWIKRPVEGQAFDSKFDSCLKAQSKLDENKEEDLPTIFWKAYFCVFEKSSVFSNEDVKFSPFVDFLTKEYGSELRDEIRSANSECAEAETETAPWKKVRKFSECFYRNERKVCHKPTVKGLDLIANNKNITDSIGLQTTCTPLEGSKKSIDSCCRNTSIPINLDKMFLMGILSGLQIYPNLNVTAVHQCRLSLLTRQSQLLKLPAGVSINSHLKSCNAACMHSPELYNGVDSLKIDDKIKLNSLYSKDYFTEHQQKQIDELIQKRRSTASINMHIFQNKNVTSKQLNLEVYADEFQKETDELIKVQLYCMYYQWLHMIVYSAFREDCTDENWTTTWLNKVTYIK